MVPRWKMKAKFRIQGQKWSFWAQISPLLPPGYTQTDSGNLYLGILWSEEAYLAINTFINEYRELSVKKLRQICRSRLKMGHFEARISHFSSCRYSKNCKNYSKGCVSLSKVTYITRKWSYQVLRHYSGQKMAKNDKNNQFSTKNG